MKQWLLCALTVGCVGCSSTYRGIPSHGGGKRFSEEQRMVAGAMRQAISTMNLKELKGKRVSLRLTGIPSSGSGNINWGGWTANVNGYDRESLKLLNRVTSPNYQDRTEDDSSGSGGSVSFRPNNNFYTSVQNTNADVNYLKAALEMKAMHEGIRFTTQKSDAVLHVLVDVLGTNRSRTNLLVYHMDELKAECELSYYAVDVKEQAFVFPSRRCSAEGVYSHGRCIVVPLPASIERKIVETVPTPLPCTNEDDVSIPKNGDHHKDGEEKNQEEVTDEAKQAYLQSMAARLRSQIRQGESKEAKETLNQIIAVDANFEELPELRDELKTSSDPKK